MPRAGYYKKPPLEWLQGKKKPSGKGPSAGVTYGKGGKPHPEQPVGSGDKEKEIVPEEITSKEPAKKKSVGEALLSMLNPFKKPEPLKHPLTGEPVINPSTGEPYGPLVAEPISIGLAGAGALGKTAIFGKVGGKMVQTTKNTRMAQSLAAKIFTPKTIGALGLSYLGSMFLSLWARSEAPEPLQFISRDVLSDAEESGDWSQYDRLKEARDEMMKTDIIEKIITFSPIIGPIANILKKFRGIAEAASIQDKIAENRKIRQEKGEDERSYWERITREKREWDLYMYDLYHNKEEECDRQISQRRSQLKGGGRSRLEQVKAEIKLWEEYKKKVIKWEREARQTSQRFWNNYMKEEMEIGGVPSKLGFGAGFGLL